MKCPHCGDEEKQESFGHVEAIYTGYRCAKCGRLYTVPSPALGELVDRLEELKTQAETLARQQADFANRIAEIEGQIRSARGE